MPSLAALTFFFAALLVVPSVPEALSAGAAVGGGLPGTVVTVLHLAPGARPETMPAAIFLAVGLLLWARHWQGRVRTGLTQHSGSPELAQHRWTYIFATWVVRIGYIWCIAGAALAVALDLRDPHSLGIDPLDAAATFFFLALPRAAAETLPGLLMVTLGHFMRGWTVRAATLAHHPA